MSSFIQVRLNKLKNSKIKLPEFEDVFLKIPTKNIKTGLVTYF